MNTLLDNPPSEFSAMAYGRKITITLDHSDLDMGELMDVFKGLAMGLGYSEQTWEDYLKS